MEANERSKTMETKHTPGPWLIQESTVYALNERRPPVNRFHASVDSGFDNCDKRISREEVCANAKLMATAPDLLADLVVAAETLRRYEALHRAKCTAKSLEKAEVNAGIACRFEQTIAKATA